MDTVYSSLDGKPCSGSVTYTWDGNPPDDYGMSTYVPTSNTCSTACSVYPSNYGGAYEGTTKTIPCCALDFPEPSC